MPQEARDAVKHHTMHRILPTPKNSQVQNANHAEDEELCSGIMNALLLCERRRVSKT